MATDIVGSLFGVTPEMFQQRQAALADKQAIEFAQLTPMQQAQAGIYRGAYGLAGALGGALGAQDPQLQLISARNAIAKQINYNDPASIMQGVQSLSQAGDTVGAMQLADVARKLQSEMAQTFQRTAAGQASLAQAARESKQATPEKIQLARELASRKGAPGSPEYETAYDAELTRLTTAPEATTPEMRNAASFASQKGAPGSPEYNAEYQTQLARLTAKAEGKEPTTNELTNARALASLKGAPGTPEYNAEFNAQLSRLTTASDKANIKEVGVAENSRKPVYLDVNTDQQFVYDTDASGKQIRKPYVGGVDRTTAKVTATSQSVQESEFSKALGKGQGARYDNAVTLRDNAIAALNTFDALSKLNDQGLISGTFASGRVGATNLLNTLGLISANDSATLARSENYQKVAGDAILATLGGKLGAGFSNDDRKFIQGLVPQLENSPAARRQLIDFMVAKNRAIVGETSRLIDFAENKRTLNGFVPSIPLPGGAGAGGLQALSDEELRKRYNAVKRGK